MKKLVFVLGLFISICLLNNCEKECEKENDPDILTGFEGNYKSDDFTYEPLGVEVNLLLKIENGIVDRIDLVSGNTECMEMQFTYKGLPFNTTKVDTIVYDGRRGKEEAYMQVGFFIDSYSDRMGLMWLAKPYDYMEVYDLIGSIMVPGPNDTYWDTELYFCEIK